MIGVEVSDEQIVDLGDSGIAGGGHDSIRIARKPGIDEQRVVLRCDDQGRLPTFHVNEVNLKLRTRRPLGRPRRHEPAGHSENEGARHAAERWQEPGSG